MYVNSFTITKCYDYGYGIWLCLCVMVGINKKRKYTFYQPGNRKKVMIMKFVMVMIRGNY